MKIVGTLHPEINTLDLKKELVIWTQQIEQSKADCVWIGLGSPKQDFVAQELALLIEQPIISVGAAFDYLSNSRPEAPQFLRILYLEWLYRLLAEPSRLWRRYIFGNLYFTRLIVIDISKNLPKSFVNSRH